jgi:hypothetical protein
VKLSGGVTETALELNGAQLRLWHVVQIRQILARDIQSTFWLKLKGLLFLVVGITSSALLFLDRPIAKVALLLVLVIWSFCRFYYFVFYVIERYVDAQYRYSGILAMLRYLANSTSRKKAFAS